MDSERNRHQGPIIVCPLLFDSRFLFYLQAEGPCINSIDRSKQWSPGILHGRQLSITQAANGPIRDC